MAPLQSRSLVTVSVGGDFYQFVDGELAPLDLSLDDSLSVADSFLVSNGSVRALERHFARFAHSIHDAKTKRQLPGFFASAAAAIPQDGDWFPRLEYRIAIVSQMVKSCFSEYAPPPSEQNQFDYGLWVMQIQELSQL